mgnify:CR=1 FL=1
MTIKTQMMYAREQLTQKYKNLAHKSTSFFDNYFTCSANTLFIPSEKKIGYEFLIKP